MIKKTHTKKYMKFSCNKMAVSDRCPFSLIFAEEEAIVLYSTNTNITNSKSVAAKNEGYMHCRIASNEWLIRTRKPLSPLITPSKVGHVPSGGVVDQDEEKYADRNVEENTIHKSYLQKTSSDIK
jgi:hypothetical protein